MNNFNDTKVSLDNINDHSLRPIRDLNLKNVPSEYFLVAAGGVFGLSVLLAATSRKKSWANFVSGLIPSIIMLGVYSKINQQQESTSYTKTSREAQADIKENMPHIH